MINFFKKRICLHTHAYIIFSCFFMDHVSASESYDSWLSSSALNICVAGDLNPEKTNRSFGLIFMHTDENENKVLTQTCKTYRCCVRNFRAQVATLITKLATENPILYNFCTHETFKDITFPDKGKEIITSCLHLNTVIVSPGGRKFSGFGRKSDTNTGRFNVLSGSITIHNEKKDQIATLLPDAELCMFSLEDNIKTVDFEGSHDKGPQLLGASDTQRRFFVFLSTPRGRRPSPGCYDLLIFNGKHNTRSYDREKESRKYIELVEFDDFKKIISITQSPVDIFSLVFLKTNRTEKTKPNATVETEIIILFDQDTNQFSVTSDYYKAPLAHSQYCFISSSYIPLSTLKGMLPSLSTYISKESHTEKITPGNIIINGINESGVQVHHLDIPQTDRLSDTQFLDAATYGLNNPSKISGNGWFLNTIKNGSKSPWIRYYVAHVWGGGAIKQDRDILSYVQRELSATITVGGNNIITRLLFGRMDASYGFDGLISEEWGTKNNSNSRPVLNSRALPNLIVTVQNCICQRLS